MSSTTYVASNSPGYTSTVPATGTQAGTIIYAYPSAGYQTLTTTYGPTSTTSTAVYASGTSSGTVYIVQPVPTDTYTTYVATNSPGYTSSYAGAGTTRGSVVQAYPSAGKFQLTLILQQKLT